VSEPGERFSTSSVALAAFLLERGIERLDAERKGSSIYFIFGDVSICRELERQFVYERPVVVVRDFLVRINECRDVLRELHGPGRLSDRRRAQEAGH
jgi:hypothetical protein